MISILCGDVHKFFQRELLLSTHARSQGRWRVCEKNILCGKKLQHAYAEYVAQLQVLTSNSCLAHPPCECTPGKLEVVNSDLVGK